MPYVISLLQGGDGEVVVDLTILSPYCTAATEQHLAQYEHAETTEEGAIFRNKNENNIKEDLRSF